MDGEASCKGFREDISIGAMPPENGLGLKTEHPQLSLKLLVNVRVIRMLVGNASY